MSIGTERFLRVDRGECLPSQNIRLRSHRFEMSRVDAAPIPTKMIDIFAFGYGAHEQLPCGRMRRTLTTIPPEASIAVLGTTGNPVPASSPVPEVGVPGFLDLGQEAFEYGKLSHGGAPPKPFSWPERGNVAGQPFSCQFAIREKLSSCLAR